MSVRKRIRRLRRYRTIAAAFARNGLGYVSHEMGLTEKLLHFRNEERRGIRAMSIGERIRLLLEELGPTFVKLGQIASSRPDLLPADILRELERLQDQVPAFPFEKASEIIEEELGDSIENLFLRFFETLKHISVPSVYLDYCSNRVLTMDYIEGIKLSDHGQLDRAGLDRRLLAERYATMILHQVLVEGFFHGDPHPGNVLALADGSLAWLDFGMMGRLSPETKKHFASFVIAMRNQSTSGVIRAISDMGVVPEETDMEELHADVEELRDKYYKVPLNRIRLGEAVHDLFSVALRHRILIPKELTLLGKTLLTMEGVVTALDPTFCVFDVAEPFGKKLFIERLDPRKILKSWMEEVPGYLNLLNEVPLSLKQLSHLLRQGKLRVEVVSPQAEALMKRMDRISNRLSISIVLLSLSIVMIGLIIGAALSHTQTLLWHIPVIEIGMGIALFMLMWLLSSIFRSGRF